MQTKASQENDIQGNTIPWEDWEKGADLAGLDPYHAHIGGEYFTRKISAYLEPPVLDMGCGWGGLLTYVQGQAVGIDLSNYCICKAKELAEDIPDVEVVQCDILNLQPDMFDRFKTVVSLDVFPLIEEKQKALDQCSRLLLPQGSVLITDYFSSPANSDLFAPYGGATPLDKESYYSAIKNANLSVEDSIDLTDQCRELTNGIIAKMKTDPLRSWMISNWSKEYYNYAVDLSTKWSEALREREIEYALMHAHNSTTNGQVRSPCSNGLL